MLLRQRVSGDPKEPCARPLGIAKVLGVVERTDSDRLHDLAWLEVGRRSSPHERGELGRQIAEHALDVGDSLRHNPMIPRQIQASARTV